MISTVTNKGQMRWRIFDGALNTNILIDFLRNNPFLAVLLLGWIVSAIGGAVGKGRRQAGRALPRPQLAG